MEDRATQSIRCTVVRRCEFSRLQEQLLCHAYRQILPIARQALSLENKGTRDEQVSMSKLVATVATGVR